MNSEASPFDDFRRLISRRARQFPAQWEASKRLIEQSALPSTIDRLLHLSQDGHLPATIKEAFRLILGQGQVRRLQDLDGKALRTLTGLHPSKALRALCVFFDLIPRPGAQWPVPAISSRQIEDRVRQTPNPFDLLRDAAVTSVLDLGAGDLSFATELVERYVPELQQQNRQLILHCVDRLDSKSRLGGLLHPERERMRALKKKLGEAFAYFSDQDMFDLRILDESGKLAPRYTIAVCWAPATPTFAYEPTRLSRSIIDEDLRRTKGTFQHVRYHGEPALEVQHGGRALLFPPWKFEIAGPLALLTLLRHRGALCILGAVDAQVFWELLAQLLDDARYRPPDRLFTSANLRDIFGQIYGALDQLPIGESIDLAELGNLRRHFPVGDSYSPANDAPVAFQHIRISRGATFPGIPASSTARRFGKMREEMPPWFLTLVPGSPPTASDRADEAPGADLRPSQ
jgi:hypothetical protein